MMETLLLPLYNILSTLFHRVSDDSTYNQYQGQDQIKNMEVYLRYHLSHPSVHKFLILGIIPSWNETVNTGIPMTSGENIHKNHCFHSLRQQLKYNLTENKQESTIFYSLMNAKIFNECLFWNIFPFYPHQIEDVYQKRSLHRKEPLEGLYYINCLNTLFHFDKIIGIGEKYSNFILESLLDDNIDKYDVLPIPCSKNKSLFQREFKRIFYPHENQPELNQQLVLNTTVPTVRQQQRQQHRVHRQHIRRVFDDFDRIFDDDNNDENKQW